MYVESLKVGDKVDVFNETCLESGHVITKPRYGVFEFIDIYYTVSGPGYYGCVMGYTTDKPNHLSYTKIDNEYMVALF